MTENVPAPQPLGKVVRACCFRLVRAFLPLRPARALAALRRDHALAAERLAEYLGVLLVGEKEDLEEPAIAVYGVPVTRQRQAALLAERPQRVEVLADALLLERDPSAGA